MKNVAGPLRIDIICACCIDTFVGAFIVRISVSIFGTCIYIHIYILRVYLCYMMKRVTRSGSSVAEKRVRRGQVARCERIHRISVMRGMIALRYVRAGKYAGKSGESLERVFRMSIFARARLASSRLSSESMALDLRGEIPFGAPTAASRKHADIHGN